MKTVILLICSLIGYLFGSIPTSIVIGKIFFKKDIREYGSKNAGGTNAGRVFGKKVGLIVIIIDIIKTIIPIIAAYFICKYTSLNNYGVTDYAYQFSAIFCIIGHCFPIFAQFKGGKGVSSFAAIIFCTNWLLTIIGLSIFFLVLKLKKYVSLSSISCAFILPMGPSYAPVYTTCLNSCGQGKALGEITPIGNVLFLLPFIAIYAVIRKRKEETL